MPVHAVLVEVAVPVSAAPAETFAGIAAETQPEASVIVTL